MGNNQTQLSAYESNSEQQNELFYKYNYIFGKYSLYLPMKGNTSINRPDFVGGVWTVKQAIIDQSILFLKPAVVKRSGSRLSGRVVQNCFLFRYRYFVMNI